MGSVNVNRNVSDAFYRYKMPRILAKVEGKGNGIKTVIVNMLEVAKAIGRPATYPCKYFGCELGAQTQFDFKNDRYIVNGSHDAAKLQDLLDGFIRKFVLCPSCDNPETELIVSTKKGTISQGCKACGFHGPLEFNHKLNTFILKNPPNLNPAVQGSSLTEGKRAKRSKKSGDQNNTSNGDGNTTIDGTDDPEDDVIIEKTSKSKQQEDDDANWAADVSEEAVRARMQDLTEGAKNMTFNDDLEKSEKERMDMFYSLVKLRRDAGQLDTVQQQKDILSEAERLEIKQKATLVLAELLFDQNICLQAKKHRLLLLRFTLNDKKAQRYLMGGIEQIIALHKDLLMAKVPGVLKLLYDLDILSEQAVIDWSDKVSKKYVSKELGQEIHKNAEPFIKWLKEAESEDSDSEEDQDGDESDEVEIEYDDRAKVTSLKDTVKAAQNSPAKKKVQVDDDGDEEDDVDIDGI